MAVDLLAVAIGVAVLAGASDMFVDGAVGISRRLGVSAVVVGAVVIGLGTSLPELLVSVLAAADGDAALGVGNVVGSNIANLTLVLGVAALLTRMSIHDTVVRREAPVSAGAVVAFAIAVRAGLPLWLGIVLLAALVVVLAILVRAARTDADPELAAELSRQAADRAVVAEEVGSSWPRLTVVTVVGLVGTALGAQLLVDGAVSIAGELGVSDGLVGVTLVAVGTSLPELVTAAQAARRGEDDLVIGNVLGSNLFNSLLVGGAIAVVAPGVVDDPALESVGLASMATVAVAAWVLMARGRRVSRVEAGALLVGWVVSIVLMARAGATPVA